MLALLALLVAASHLVSAVLRIDHRLYRQTLSPTIGTLLGRGSGRIGDNPGSASPACAVAEDCHRQSL